MASNYDDIDFDFTWDGDFTLDECGDLKDTTYDYLQSLKQEIQTYIKSSIGDWKEEPSVGASLDDFVGEPNNRITASEMKARVESSLSEIVNLQDLSVRIVPVGIYNVLVILTVDILPTTENKFPAGTSFTTTFLYDYLETGVYIDIDDQAKFGGRSI